MNLKPKSERKKSETGYHKLDYLDYMHTLNIWGMFLLPRLGKLLSVVIRLDSWRAWLGFKVDFDLLGQSCWKTVEPRFQASPVLCSSVCVQYNAQKWKNGEKTGSSTSVCYTEHRSKLETRLGVRAVGRYCD